MGFWAHLDRRALFERGDVYRVAFDAERAARTPVRVAVLGAGGVAQSKYLPALAQLRTRWEPVELVALSTLDARGAEKLSSLWGVPRRLLRRPSVTCGGLGLPRFAAAIFSRRAGSPALACPFALPAGPGS